MNDIENISTINKVGNKIIDVLEENGVVIGYSPSFGKAILRIGSDWLALDQINRETKPKAPTTWEEFVDMAVDIFDRKNTDYESAFMNILLDKDVDGRSIWAWEVKKKLDRLRRWIKRGELKVKGEGTLDSVLDFTIYTVQYELSGKMDPYSYLNRKAFREQLEYLGHEFLMRYLINHSWAGVKFLDLDDDVDKQVHDLILKTWGVKSWEPQP